MLSVIIASTRAQFREQHNLADHQIVRSERLPPQTPGLRVSDSWGGLLPTDQATVGSFTHERSLNFGQYSSLTTTGAL